MFGHLYLKTPPQQKVMIKYTITEWNVVKKIVEKLDMTKFGVKYLEIGLVFFLISCINLQKLFGMVCFYI